MAERMDTAEILAVKFPNCHHLIPELEEACKDIKERGEGWGRIGIDATGLDAAKNILVKFVDVQFRRFRRSKPGKVS